MKPTPKRIVSNPHSVEKGEQTIPNTKNTENTFQSLPPAASICLHILLRKLAKKFGFSLEDIVIKAIHHPLTPPDALVKDATGAAVHKTDKTPEKAAESAMLSLALQYTYRPF